MKELTKEHLDTAIEVNVTQEQKKQLKLIGKQRRIPGPTLWEFNDKTKSLTKATFKLTSISLDKVSGKNTLHHQVIINDDCFYFQALNRKSAIKKLRK